MYHLRFRHVYYVGRCIGRPYPLQIPPSVHYIGLKRCINQNSLFGSIQVPDSSSTSIVGVSTAHPWRHACLARLLLPLLFEVDFLLVRLWRTCFNSSSHTGYVNSSYCQTPVLLLFTCYMLLVLSFLCVGGGEEENFIFSNENV